MIQNPEKNNHGGLSGEQEEKPLDVVVGYLIKNQSKEKHGLKEGKSYDAIFKDIKSVLTQFDTSIDQCKKYNEAKIHRKYQIMIADLQKQSKILRQKLRLEQNARSPSKKYIEDLIEKLVKYKSENDELKQQNEKLRLEKETLLESKLMSSNINLRNTQMIPDGSPPKSNEKRSKKSSIKQSQKIGDLDVKNQLSAFLSYQNSLRRSTDIAKSRFQGFLRRKLQDQQMCTLFDLLSQINKWSVDHHRANDQKVQAKIINSALQTLEDESISRPNVKLPHIKTAPRTFEVLSNHDLKNFKRVIDYKKSRSNYSTVEVAAHGIRQKYPLK